MTLALGSAVAQQGTGNVVGTVDDTSGAVISGAEIKIENIETHKIFTSKTNESGFYASSPLIVGTYRVSASLPGFKTAITDNVIVAVDRRAEVDLTLEVGKASQSVVVTAAPPEMNTTSGTLGVVLAAKPIHELPLNGRNVLALETLTPGVRNNIGATQEGFANRGDILSATSINGSPTGSNGDILDGQNNLQAVTGETAINPTVDAIQEFKVQSGVMSAEYGFTAGGVVNLVSRSGTDQYHGTAYEFFRNNALDAENAFTPAGSPSPELRYNQYGAAVGGPIIHRRTFFFGNWEEFRYVEGSPQYMTVPTPQERNGNFSDLFGTNGKLIQLYDPSTTTPNPNGAGYVRSPFPGNVIPPSRLDPVALAIQKDFYPLPNTTPTNILTHANNFSFLPTTVSFMRQALGRVDHQVNARNSAFIRYAYDDNQTNDGAASSVAAPALYPNPIAANRYDNMRVQSAIISDTQIFSNSLTNTLFVAATRVDFSFLAASYGQGWPQKLGLPTSIPSFTLPIVSNGLPNFNGTAGYRAYTNPQVADTAMKVIRTHTISFGVDWRKNIGSNAQMNAPSGSFNFPSTLTGNPQVPTGTGSTYATYLLGAVGSAVLTATTGETDRSFDMSAFVQDDWKVSGRLTVNAGLRYDYQQQPYEQNNGYSNFNLAARDPVNGFLGSMEYATVGGFGRNFVKENYDDFSPRIGFAYSVTKSSKTVLRGGYGIYYPLTYNSLYTGSTQGFSTTSTVYNPPGNNTNYPAFQFSQGVPYPELKPLGAGYGPSGFLGGTVTSTPAKSPTPMSQQWTLTLEQQLPKNIVAQGTWAVNEGSDFVAGGYNMNQINPTYLSLGQSLEDQVPNPYAGKVPGALGAPTISRQQSLLPFPYYSSVNIANPHDGGYNGQYFELTVEKQYQNGLMTYFGYTAGKLLDGSIAAPLAFLSSATSLTGYQNVYDRGAEFSLDPTDVSQRATISILYDLPFGSDRRFRSNRAYLNQLIGGWQINTIGVIQTGFPLAIQGANNFTASRPNYVPGVSPNLSHRTKTEWFNTAAFVNPPDFTFGNVPRTLPSTRAPGTVNFDLSLFKTTPIHKQVALQFRVEAFNAFNHVNMNAPNTSFVPGANGLNANGAFGTITSASDGRAIQLALKLIF